MDHVFASISMTGTPGISIISLLVVLWCKKPNVRTAHWTKGRIVTNTLALGLASFVSFWEHSPESVNLGAIAATMLIGIDTAFGVATAAVFQEFRSRLLRERLVSKFLYYGLFVLTAYVLGALLKAYWMMAGCWYAVTLIELASVMETLTRLHIKGGKRFGPAEKLLKIFASAMGEAAKSALPNPKDVAGSLKEDAKGKS
jgi:hypothetical protein